GWPRPCRERRLIGQVGASEKGCSESSVRTALLPECESRRPTVRCRGETRGTRGRRDRRRGERRQIPVASGTNRSDLLYRGDRILCLCAERAYPLPPGVDFSAGSKSLGID